MKSERPVFISLTKYRFPITAISSILHRIAGVLMFLGLPLLMYMLHESLFSQQRFDMIGQFMRIGWVKFYFWVTLSAVFYHLFAGIRHLIMDCGFAESLRAARITALVVILLGVITTILVGVWIW